MAEVAGHDEYDVEVQLSNTEEIVDSFCNCPYDGPYCKHEVTDGVYIDLNNKSSRQKWEDYAYYAHEVLGNKGAMRAIAFPLAVEGLYEA